MKKFLILFIAVISMSAFTGCEAEDDFNPPNFATFDKTAYSLSVNQDGSSTMDVTVYTANISGSARTYNIVVDPTSTLSAAALTIPSTVTIPANSNEATFTVDVSDTNLNNAGNTLVLRLEGEPGSYVGQASTINIARICPFEIPGNYMITEGAATTTRPLVIAAGTAANSYIVRSMYADSTDVTFTVNPATGVVTLPVQPGFVHPTLGATTVTALAGSKVEPCDQKITLMIRRTVADGRSFATRTDVLVKTAE